MSKAAISDHRLHGKVVLDRFATQGVPAALKTYVAAFKNQHAALEAAAEKAEKARAVRDAVLAKMGEADDVLDRSVDALADALVGAGLGARRDPFTAYSKYTPARLKDLAYLTEVKEVRALCENVTKAKPPANVARAVATVRKNADALDAAVAALSGPQSAYEQAIAARDRLLPEWTRALARLQRNAAAHWFETPETYRAVFAVPALVQKPVKRRKKAADSNAAKKPEQPTT
jgi:hypothetical protein